MSDDRIKVLYIAGLGRSGTTLLGNILGQVDGFVSVGEIRLIWDNGLIMNKICGCGVPFEECEMWQPVFSNAFGATSKVDAHKIIHLRESWARTKHIPLMLTLPGGRLIERRLAEYLDNLGKLYRAIRTVTGSRVIVDTSKFPSYGFVLGMVPSVDLHVVHLVRDPRAVAYSYMRKKLQPDPETPEYTPQESPTGTSLRWAARNLGTEALWWRSKEKYLMLRYEDFIAEPRRSIERTLELVGEGTTPLPHVGEHEVKLGANHNIWGNPNRFQTGLVRLRPDDEWAFRMRSEDRRLITALTFPLLTRYGYPLIAGRRGPAGSGEDGGR